MSNFEKCVEDMKTLQNNKLIKIQEKLKELEKEIQEQTKEIKTNFSKELESITEEK